ncbi:hypothetical protein WJX79_005918 [Trebouxia sp. C0005]
MDSLNKEHTQERKKREPNYNMLIPLVYAPLLPLLRIGLNGRVAPKTRDGIFIGAVLTALFHAGYVMSGERLTARSLGHAVPIPVVKA